MKPEPEPAAARRTAPVAAITSRRPDTRRVPLAALKTRAALGVEDLPGAQRRGVVVTASFNSAI